MIRCFIFTNMIRMIIEIRKELLSKMILISVGSRRYLAEGITYNYNEIVFKKYIFYKFYLCGTLKIFTILFSIEK